MKPAIALSLIAATAFPLVSVAAEVLAPLPVQLPLEVFKGTPTEEEFGPNVEPYSDKLRPPFLAPAGVTNVALGRPVTSSDPEPISGQLAMITDGDKEGHRDTVVELRRRTQWVQIDLGKPVELAAVVLWHAHHVHMVCHDVIVQVSNDPEFKEGVTTLYNNDYDNSSRLGLGRDKEYFESHQGRLIDAKGAKARYLRVYGHGSTFVSLNWFTEVEAWGRPAPARGTNALAPMPLRLPVPAFKGTPRPQELGPNVEPFNEKKLRPPFLAPVGASNLARGRPVTSSDPEPVSGQLEQITNGDKEGRRESLVELHRGTQRVQIDLGQPATLAAVIVWHAHHVHMVCRDVIVQVSNDPEFKEGVTTLFNNDYDNSSRLGVGRDKEYVESYEGRLIDAKGAQARYVRVHGRGSTFTRLNWFTEIEVWGLVE